MPNKIQLQRYESIIKDIINNSLNNEITNKVALNAKVTNVKLTNDLSFANIYIDCLHRETIDKVITHLNKIKGFLRHKVATKLNTYKTPELRFYVDKTLDYANKIEDLLKQIKEKDH